jgi:hypothetical protein
MIKVVLAARIIDFLLLNHDWFLYAKMLLGQWLSTLGLKQPPKVRTVGELDTRHLPVLYDKGPRRLGETVEESQSFVPRDIPNEIEHYSLIVCYLSYPKFWSCLHHYQVCLLMKFLVIQRINLFHYILSINLW